MTCFSGAGIRLADPLELVPEGGDVAPQGKAPPLVDEQRGVAWHQRQLMERTKQLGHGDGLPAALGADQDRHEVMLDIHAQQRALDQPDPVPQDCHLMRQRIAPGNGPKPCHEGIGTGRGWDGADERFCHGAPKRVGR